MALTKDEKLSQDEQTADSNGGEKKKTECSAETADAAKFLEAEVPQQVKNDFAKEQKGKDDDLEGLIRNVNQKVLIDTLSPEVKENEKAKRGHKKALIIILAIFLVVQFLATAILSYFSIKYACTQSANAEIVNSLLTFVTAYITSVVVELIAILRYIVKNVFDTSIAELLKVFKDNEN